jgi:hypothetical protein
MTHDLSWDPTTVIIASVTPTREMLHNNCDPIDDLLSLSDVYDEHTFMSRVVGAVTVHDARPQNASYYIGARNCHSHVSVKEVARKFKCGL